jgi:hypothetical protein
MRISSIVTVVVRLFAIQTFVHGLSFGLSITGSLVAVGDSPRGYFNYIVPIVLWGFAAFEWFLAPAISRLVTRGFDSVVTVTAFTREDLYSFAFVFLGLYFILSSIAPALDWLHYFLTISGRGAGQEPHVRKSFYDLASPLITLIAGFTTLLPANRWARRLLKMERQRETV